MGAMNSRQPDYEEKRKILTEKAAIAHAVYLAESKELIAKHVTDSTKKLIALTNFDDPSFASAASIQLQAIKHHLKLAGLETEKQEISSTVTFTPLKLSQEDFGDE